MTTILRVAACAATVALAGCASSSDEIAAAYVSPLTYQHYDCAQIAAEQQRVSARAAQLAGGIDENATGDAVAMGVGLALFWPALLFIDGDGPEAHEYARLQGEHEALSKVAVEKNCASMNAAAQSGAAPGPTRTADEPAFRIVN